MLAAARAAEKTALQKQIEGAQKAKDKKVQWLLEALPEKSVAQQVSREIQARLDDVGRLTDRLAEIDAELKELLGQDSKAEVVADFLSRFTDHFEDLETSQKRLLIQNLVKEVVIKSAEDSRVVFTLPLPSNPHLEAAELEGPLSDEETPPVPLELLQGRREVFPSRYKLG